MAAIVFPSSPSVGDIYTNGGYSWRWTGVVWESIKIQQQGAFTEGVLSAGNASSNDGTLSVTALENIGLPSPYSNPGAAIVSNGSVWVTQQVVIPGTILMWATNVAPSGYLLCDGSAVSRTAYSQLFNIIGTTFGIGNGSTTFNLPNYKDRMPVGSGNSYALADTGGSATTTLTTANLPAHNHTASVTDPGHLHGSPTISTGGAFGGQSAASVGNAESFTSGGPATSSATTGISVTTANTGNGSEFNTISPYLAIQFIIKY